jgi:hypothetical protein
MGVLGIVAALLIPPILSGLCANDNGNPLARRFLHVIDF